MQDRKLQFILSVVFLLSIHCDRAGPGPASPKADEHGGEAVATNRVDVPETVRKNLGITFAKVESRPVAETIRVPGQFELQPQARREYRTMLAGRVELLVKQLESVEPGMPIYRLASPEWRDLQQKLSESINTIRQAEARVASIPSLLAAHRNHEDILREGVTLWETRVAEVEKNASSGVVSVADLTELKNNLAMKRAELAEVLEKEAELEAQSATARAEHDAAHARFRLLLATASTLLGIDERELAAPFQLDEHLHTGPNIEPHEENSTTQPAPRWREIDEIQVKSTAPGLVATTDLTNGAWASAGALVLSTIEPQRLRFRAMAMQGDLGRLRDGLPARIVPPTGGTIALQDTMNVSLTIGQIADPQERTIELIATPERLAAWARAGVSAHLEIITAGGQPELAIPLSCVIQDGLEKIIFRRDPKNPDKVIRMKSDLGVNDGRWVVINSGVLEGDDIVFDCVYQLMIATSGSAEKGGHFHADGSFHGEEDKK